MTKRIITGSGYIAAALTRVGLACGHEAVSRPQEVPEVSPKTNSHQSGLEREAVVERVVSSPTWAAVHEALSDFYPDLPGR